MTLLLIVLAAAIAFVIIGLVIEAAKWLLVLAALLVAVSVVQRFSTPSGRR